MKLLKFKKKNAWLYIILALLVYFSYYHYKTSVDFGAILKDEKSYSEKVAHEEDRKEALARVEEKASSQKTIEAMARADLYYLKDGEILIIDGEDAEK